jgi:hypothetical protein
MSHLHRMAKAYQEQLWQDAKSTQRENRARPARPALVVEMLRRIRFRLDAWAWLLWQESGGSSDPLGDPPREAVTRTTRRQSF